MRRRGAKQADDAEVDMTPMLDIVFIMLIFFIVTAVFMDEKGVDLTQPPPPPEDNTPPKDNPAILVYINGSDLCSVDEARTECENVQLAVQKILAEKPGASVILRVDEGAKHKTLILVKDDLDASSVRSKIEVLKSQET